MKYLCAYCGKENDKLAGCVNRARARGLNLYCNIECSSFGRRQGKTKAQKVEEKRLYDIEYRAKNRLALKAKKREYFKRTYDPARASIMRKKRMPYHVEYCRQPWYREWKRKYDSRRRAGEFGEFADAYTLTLELTREVKRRDINAQIKYENGGTNKAQRRRREAQKKESGASDTSSYG